jgi:sulfatase modifying factor 1
VESDHHVLSLCARNVTLKIVLSAIATISGSDLMAESYDLVDPAGADSEEVEVTGPPPVHSAPKPLPRLWKAEPEVDPEDQKAEEIAGRKAGKETDSTARKSRKKSVEPKNGKDGTEKGVLLEETPRLDTHETRQRIRIAVGSLLTLVMLMIGYGIYRAFTGSPVPVDVPVDPNLAIVAPTGATLSPREKNEQEAKVLLDRAREVAKNDKTDLAVSLLTRVATTYPTTRAGLEAKEALARPNKKLPLFLDRNAVVASSPGETPKKTANAAQTKAPEIVVDATKSEIGPPGTGTATLTPPSNIPPPTTPPPSVAPPPNYRALPPGFRPRQGVEAHASGWALEIVGDRDNATMMLVMGATFVQGRDGTDGFESPAHQVNLATYYIDQHEVTVRQFNLFQKEMGRRLERDKAIRDHAQIDANEDLPVVMVKARDAADYAAWAGKRMPTEAQWEAAARSPDARFFPWGNNPPEWIRPRAFHQIDPVMSFPADVSPYGVFDMAGNASEWTKDWFESRYYNTFRNTTADNPTGPPVPPKPPQLVIKGIAKDWSVAKREGMRTEARLPYLGFRCVLEVEGPGNAFEAPGPDQNANSNRKAGQGQAGNASAVPF